MAQNPANADAGARTSGVFGSANSGRRSRIDPAEDLIPEESAGRIVKREQAGSLRSPPQAPFIIQRVSHAVIQYRYPTAHSFPFSSHSSINDLKAKTGGGS